MKRLSYALGLLTLGVGLFACKRKGPPSAPFEAPVIVSSGTIGEGGSLSDSLGQAGIPPLESAQVERTLKPLFNPRYSKAKDKYEVTKSTSGHLIRMLYWVNSFEYFTVTRSTSGTFAAAPGKASSERTLVGASGKIQGSLWDAMSAQGVPPEMIIRFAELFSWRIDFLTEPRVGDTYKIIWRRSTGHGAVRDEDIVCASYTNAHGETLYAYPLAHEYFDADGNSLKGEFLRAPLVYRRISSFFTEHRYHPILRYYRPHHGIDYAAPAGTPASSIAEGTVISRGWEDGLGNELRVRHSGSYVSIYGHLRGYARGIRVGSHVKQGQVIGYVGSTGLSTGPHLHFGFERDGRLMNFFSLKFKNSRKRVPMPEQEHFKQVKAYSQALMSQLTGPGTTIQTLSPAANRVD